MFLLLCIPDQFHLLCIRISLLSTVKVVEHSLGLVPEGDYIRLTIDLNLHDPISKMFLEFQLHVGVASYMHYVPANKVSDSDLFIIILFKITSNIQECI